MLKVNNLSKKYNNDFYGLKDVSFELKEGEIVGLVGKNGAGKTTLIKLLSKALKPTSGEILLDGVDINKQKNSLTEASFLLEPVFYSHLSAYENIKFYLEVNNLERYINNIDQVLKLVDLYKRKDDNPGSFSFGMKQRLGVAMSLVAEPKLVVLDEPFVGLDPIGVEILINVLKEWAYKRKITVLISSHQLAELQQICERYLHIEAGHLKDSFTNSSESMTLIELKNVVDSELLASVAPNAHIDGTKVYINETSGELRDTINLLASTNEIINVKTLENDVLSEVFKEGN